MDRLFDIFTHIFDPIYSFWENHETQRRVSAILVVIFLLTLAAIELNRQHLLPVSLAEKIPVSHYKAISLAFTLVLILEVVSLIFTLPCSISRALGKQFEILALIFLRSTFKDLATLPEPVTIAGHIDEFWSLLADGCGALAIFALLGIYAKMLQKSEEPQKPSEGSLYRFVAAKKIVALFLLAIFMGMGFYNGWLLMTNVAPFHFFQHFYTVLIFCDILLVLIAQCFQPGFKAVFRNSGYALATLLIRLALTAPPLINVLVGVASAVFALLLTLVYDKFYSTGKTL